MGKVVPMTKKERIKSSRKPKHEANSTSALDFLEQNSELVKLELEIRDEGLGVKVSFKNSPLMKLYSAEELHDAIDESLLRSLSDNLMEVLIKGIIKNVE